MARVTGIPSAEKWGFIVQRMTNEKAGSLWKSLLQNLAMMLPVNDGSLATST